MCDKYSTCELFHDARTILDALYEWYLVVDICFPSFLYLIQCFLCPPMRARNERLVLLSSTTCSECILPAYLFVCWPWFSSPFLNLLFLLRLVPSRNDDSIENDVKIAAVSRTDEPEWMDELFSLFEMRRYFDFREIFPGRKVTLFAFSSIILWIGSVYFLKKNLWNLSDHHHLFVWTCSSLRFCRLHISRICTKRRRFRIRTWFFSVWISFSLLFSRSLTSCRWYSLIWIYTLWPWERSTFSAYFSFFISIYQLWIQICKSKLQDDEYRNISDISRKFPEVTCIYVEDGISIELVSHGIETWRSKSKR